jgi:phage gp29-like protein
MAVLYDQFGREITVQARPETREIAVAALRDRWSSYPSHGLTPAKLAAILKEADAGDVYRQAELFEEMEEKDAHIYSQFQTRKNAVLGLDYDVEPWSSSAEDKRIRDFVADCVLNLGGFEGALRDMLDAIPKGYSMTEISWLTDAGRAVIAGLRWIHPKRAVFYDRQAGSPWDPSYEMPRVTTEAEPTVGELMPPFKMVYHHYKARSGYDTRAGIMRVCAWMYLFKNYSIKDWVAFAEVFGMPLRVGKYDPGASKADKDALAVAIQSLGSDAAGIISKSTEIEFVESVRGASSENIFQALAEFCDKQMSKAILGQTATTEGTPGKLGNEDAQDKVRHDLIRDDAESLAGTIRFQLVRPLVGYNFGWDKPLPWFKIYHDPPEDLKLLAEVYKNVWSMGQPIAQEHVADRFKIPLPEQGQTVLPAPAAPGGRPAAGDAAAVAAKRRPGAPGAAGRGLPPGTRLVVASDGTIALAGAQDPADAVSARLGEEAAALADPFVAAVAGLVASAGSLEEIRDGIAALYDGMDPEALGVLIAQALLVAQLSGRNEVIDETGGA